MKTTTLPPIRVSPAFRKQAEALLEEGETLSSLVLEAVTRTLEIRRQERGFIARGLASSRKARRTGLYVEAAEVLAGLRAQLDPGRKATASKSRPGRSGGR